MSEAANNQRSAGDALATLAQGNQECQALIAAAGGIPPLVELITPLPGRVDEWRGKRVTHKDAAHALAQLAGDEDNKTQIARAGGIGPLVALLSTGDSKTQQCAGQKALRTLISLLLTPPLPLYTALLTPPS